MLNRQIFFLVEVGGDNFSNLSLFFLIRDLLRRKTSSTDKVSHGGQRQNLRLKESFSKIWVTFKAQS